VLWAEGGGVPAGDDVPSPEAVRDPVYGFTFTLLTRSGIPPCGTVFQDLSDADALESPVWATAAAAGPLLEAEISDSPP
jgi:hypothetical protein